MIALVALVAGTTPPISGDDDISRSVSEKLPRLGCSSEDQSPAGRQNTTERLQRLRDEMIKANISAYIITTHDEHQV